MDKSKSGPPRAGLYIRISTPDRGKRHRFEVQRAFRREEAAGRAEALRRGWEVARVYADGERAPTLRKRVPGYEAMRTDLEDRAVDVALCWDEGTATPSAIVSADSICLSSRLDDVGLLDLDDQRTTTGNYHPSVVAFPPDFMAASGAPTEPVHIDVGVMPLVRTLWRSGIPTHLSCQGGDRVLNHFRPTFVMPAHVGVPEDDSPALVRVGRRAGLNVRRNWCGVSLPAGEVVPFAYALNGYTQPRLW